MGNDNFEIIINLNSINDPNSQIKYDSFWGGTYKGSFSWVALDWTAQTDKGLQGYNVYYSVFPMIQYLANTTGLVTGTHFEMGLPLFPQNIYFYFWISKVVNNKVVNNVETFLNIEGWTSYKTALKQTIYEQPNPIDPNFNFPETDNINESLKEAEDRILIDRKMAIQMKGAKCQVYFRRWGTQAPYGVPCTCTEDKTDPDFMGSTRCPLCFGTGIIGGYYPPIEMLINFNMQPAQDFKGYIKGLTVEQTYDCWTIVPPFVRELDLIVREIDGRRWSVKQVVQNPTLRGAVNSQYFKLDLLSMTDIKQIVSLNNINAALETLNNPKFNVQNRVSF